MLQATILEQKRARKNAADEALLLYNRVRQLQKEEEKAQKRIVETKKKAKEIIKLRERNELKLHEKQERARGQAELLEQQKIENLKAKEEALRNRIEQENRVLTEKLSVVQQTKEERVEIERLLAESRLLSRKEALEQKEVIRKEQENARRKIETLKLSKLQAVSACATRALRPLAERCAMLLPPVRSNVLRTSPQRAVLRLRMPLCRPVS